MQTVIQVISTGTTSLRDAIVNDKHLGDFDLVISEHKRLTRPHGWAKLHMQDERGAINLQWHGASQTLICRIVTRGGKPNAIAGAFTSYLLARLPRKIHSIQIIPG